MYLFQNPPSSRALSRVRVERASLARGRGAACPALRAPTAPASSLGARPPRARGVGAARSPVTQGQLQSRFRSGQRADRGGCDVSVDEHPQASPNKLCVSQSPGLCGDCGGTGTLWPLRHSQMEGWECVCVRMCGHVGMFARAFVWARVTCVHVWGVCPYRCARVCVGVCLPVCTPPRKCTSGEGRGGAPQSGWVSSPLP